MQTMTPSEADQLFATAAGHHQAGRLAEAEAVYRRVLADTPNHIMSLRFLGLLAHQVGRHDAAAELLGNAIAVNGGDADSHYNLGAVLQVLGRLAEAATNYSKA